MATQSVVWKSV